MRSTKWLDRTQPQTLMTATILLYINAALGILYGLVLGLSIIAIVPALGAVAAGWGIANEKKWGYWLGVVLAVLLLALTLLSFSFGALLNLIFYGALVALLLHPQSRSYRQAWFR